MTPSPYKVHQKRCKSEHKTLQGNIAARNKNKGVENGNGRGKDKTIHFLHESIILTDSHSTSIKEPPLLDITSKPMKII